jgi:hypothetical protein
MGAGQGLNWQIRRRAPETQELENIAFGKFSKLAELG